MSRAFDGNTANFLSAGDTAAVDITGTIVTMSAWYRPNNFTGHRAVAIKGNGASAAQRQYGFYVEGTSAVPTFQVGDASSVDNASAPALTANVWAHIAGRKNGTGAGALVAATNGSFGTAVTSNRTIQNRADAFCIGRFSDANFPADGLIAEVAIWDVALSDAEIKALAKGVSPLSIRPQNLRGYWPLWGTGSPERDYSGRGSHATINGTVAAGTRNPPVSSYSVPLGVGEVGPQTIYADASTVRIAITPSSIDVADTGDTAEVYVDIQVASVDVREQYDSAEIYIDIRNTGAECYSAAHLQTEGEATARWSNGSDVARWTGEEETRWYATAIASGEAC